MQTSSSSIRPYPYRHICNWKRSTAMVSPAHARTSPSSVGSFSPSLRPFTRCVRVTSSAILGSTTSDLLLLSTFPTIFGSLAQFCSPFSSRSVAWPIKRLATVYRISTRLDSSRRKWSIWNSSTSSSAFAHSFELIRDMTFTDALLSGLKTTFTFARITYASHIGAYIPGLFYQTYGQCSCETTPLCTAAATISDVFVMPGLYIGCYLIEAMRQSSLICLYNQTCLDRMSFYLQSTANFTARAMAVANTSQFSPSSKISELLAVMMVESWTGNISYAEYFQHCRPSSCAYTILRKHGLVYILTTVLGIFGGLSKSLFVLVPLIVRWLKNRCGRRRILPHVQTPKGSSVTKRLQKGFSRIQSMNMFPSYPPSTDPYELKTQRVMTIILSSLFGACRSQC